MELRRGDGTLDDDLPEIPGIEIDRVDQEEVLHRLTIVVNGIEL